MQPEIDVLGLPIKTFGVMFALGFVASGMVIARRLKEWGRPVDWAYEMVFAALIGGLVGSRLYYVAEHSGDLASDPLGTLFGGTGLVWYGGLVGGALGVVLWAHRRGLLGLALLDLASVPLALGYAIGRVGCQLSGDGDYGRPTDLPWGMAYPDGTVPTTERVQPTPVYETFAMGLVAWLLWRYRDRVRPGILFAWYLVGAGVERFGIEFLRRNAEVAGGLTAPQLESIGLVLVGAGWLVLAARRGALRAAPAAAAAPAT